MSHIMSHDKHDTHMTHVYNNIIISNKCFSYELSGLMPTVRKTSSWTLFNFRKFVCKSLLDKIILSYCSLIQIAFVSVMLAFIKIPRLAMFRGKKDLTSSFLYYNRKLGQRNPNIWLKMNWNGSQGKEWWMGAEL